MVWQRQVAKNGACRSSRSLRVEPTLGPSGIRFLGRLVLASAFFLLTPPPGVATTTSRFTRLSVDQGLSQSTVQAILQDHLGFLWFGTEEGLNRYDGYSFVVFKYDSKDPRSLPDDAVSALHEDRAGRLWVGTEQGLCLFDRRTETFTRVPPILNRVTDILEGSDGTLWVGAEGGGLFLRNPVTGALASYQPDPRRPESLVAFGVSALLMDRSGRLWVGTKDGGVDFFAEGGKLGKFIHHRHDPHDPRSLSNDEVWGLAEDRTGNLWVATHGGGLSVRDPKTGSFRHYQRSQGDPHGLPTDLLTSVFADRSGTLWVGTDGSGLLRYDPVSDRFIALSRDSGDPTTLSQNVVRSIYEDAQGQLWVGTFLGGVNLLRKTRHDFGYFTHSRTDPRSLSDPSVAAFLEDSEGRIWVGTEGGWLNRFDAETETFVRYRFPSGQPGGSAILSLHQDRRGRIWVGSYRGGLGRFDPRRGSFVVYKHRPGDPKSLEDDEVWAIAGDEEGALWLGTNGGLDRFDPDRGVVTNHFQATSSGGLSYTGVRSLLFDRQRNLWVGTLGGLDLLRRRSSNLVSYQHNENDPRSLSNDGVVALKEDPRGGLWVGTLGGGLDHFDPETGIFMAYKNFPSNVIYGIQKDRSGQLWLSTNHGLSHLDPATGEVVNFDMANGLESLQFHLGASLKLRNGHILFGSTDGFYDFDPEVIKPDTYAPPVILTSLRVFNEPVKLPAALSTVDEITLSPQDKIFSLEFAALDFNFPRRNHYAYQMEGFSNHWIQLGEKREVTFTNLDPGTYVFRVKATNSDNVWTARSAAALKVIVEPPFWKTWWFRGSIAVLFVLGLLTAHRVRVRSLTDEIVERRRAELAMRASEERFSKAFHSSPASMSIGSLETGRAIDVNESFLKLFGYQRDEVIGRTAEELRTWTDSPSRQQAVAILRGHGTIRNVQTRFRTKSGKLFDTLLSAEIISFGGEECLLVVILDFTEQKRLEEQLRQSQKMDALGQLAGGVAHDFNNLLEVIMGYSEMLGDAMSASAPQKGHLQQIHHAAERAAGLTRQLLAFSRKQVLQPTILDLNTVVPEVEKLLRRVIGENITLITQRSPAFAGVSADRGQIELVILNLSLNARDAMPDGGKLTIETANVELDESYAHTHPEAAPGSYVMLAVSDTGKGMDAATRAHIFEPFFTTKERGKGTGLGLSTVYGIVKQSGGHIWLYSEPGRGTTFKIYFPRVAKTVLPAEAAPVKSKASKGSETVLVVEDEEAVRKLECEALARCGYRVFEAQNAEQALALSAEHPEPIHVLVTDMVMPGKGGHELARELRLRRPDLKILYLSGYTGCQFFELGNSSAFLQKPFALNVLTSKVRELLDTKSF